MITTENLFSIQPKCKNSCCLIWIYFNYFLFIYCHGTVIIIFSLLLLLIEWSNSWALSNFQTVVGYYIFWFLWFTATTSAKKCHNNTSISHLFVTGEQGRKKENCRHKSKHFHLGIHQPIWWWTTNILCKWNLCKFTVSFFRWKNIPTDFIILYRLEG